MERFVEIICCDESHLKKLEDRIYVLNVICGFQKDDKIMQQICKIQSTYKKHFQVRIMSIIKLQARARGWILRLDKFLCNRAIQLIQERAKKYIQFKKQTRSATFIQKTFRTHNLKIKISPKKLREYMMSYHQVCKKNEHLSNIILKMIQMNRFEYP